MKTRTQLRRERRRQTAELIAAGIHTRRSHYQTAEIRDVVQADLQAKRDMMEALRRKSMDPSWHYDEATALEHLERLEQERAAAQ